MKTMTLDEILAKPLTEKDIKIINTARPICTEVCPAQTKEELKGYKAWYYVHPQGDDMYKVKMKKQSVCIRLDCDILAKLKESGKGYQSRINSILRQHLFT